MEPEQAEAAPELIAPELIAYVFPGWEPRIRPADHRRKWMDQSPESFPYRCLPLKIANSHGWEILSPCGFTALWNGGPLAEDVSVHCVDPVPSPDAPVPLFGQGVLTFHIPAIFRTPPGWDLWISGPPNSMKDGVAPLSGIVETDWSPYTFTMNWRFTRPNHPVHFAADEPICFLFPIERGAAERFRTRIAPIDEADGLRQQFEDWSRSRTAFHQEMALRPPTTPADKWQKHYYRGVDAREQKGPDTHRTRLNLCPFSGPAQKPG
ncbi:MAG: DUF6065 family protein [Caulobacteraceae bacterium]|nr:DUF6065 family protein [Caulobacteraceae bacterium]